MIKLLIDGDIVVYQSASATEKVVYWGDDPTYIQDIPRAFQKVDLKISYYKRQLKSDDILIFLSDSPTFRYELFPGYKANRIGKHKPEHLSIVRKYIKDKYPCVVYPNLEADDALGIYQTKHRGKTVQVTIDKDAETIPGRRFNPNCPEKGIYQVTAKQALYTHMKQSMMGDPTDGYYGIKGVGVKKACKILDKAIEDSGKTPKQMSLNEMKVLLWEAVEAAYVSKGLSQEEAVLTARLAYILQSRNWNKGEIIQWEIPK